MKGFSFILALSAFSLSVAAQKVEPNINKPADKGDLQLKGATPTNPSSKPANDSTLKRDSLQLRMGRRMILDSLPSTRRSFSPPEQNNIGRMPNAMPTYQPPAFAAMPNAAGRPTVRAIPLGED